MWRGREGQRKMERERQREMDREGWSRGVEASPAGPAAAGPAKKLLRFCYNRECVI